MPRFTYTTEIGSFTNLRAAEASARHHAQQTHTTRSVFAKHSALEHTEEVAAFDEDGRRLSTDTIARLRQVVRRLTTEAK